jgi:hypothetical protein
MLTVWACRIRDTFACHIPFNQLLHTFVVNIASIAVHVPGHVYRKRRRDAEHLIDVDAPVCATEETSQAVVEPFADT